MKKIIFYIVVLFVCINTFAQENVLFIGNSMTFYNEMPVLFRNIAEAKGKELIVESFTEGGVGLAQHVAEAEVFRIIASRQWDKVVLQPGTSESAGLSLRTDSVASLVRQLIDSIKIGNTDAKVVIYEISNGIASNDNGGGNYDYYFYTQGIIKDSVTNIARLSGVPFAPVGECFREHYYTAHHDLMLHSSFNDVHPNLKGSYLGACAIYETLYEEYVIPCDFYSSLTEEDALYLQTITDSVVLPRKEEWLMGENVNIANTEYHPLTIYPNPTNGVINVGIGENAEVYDITGRRVMSGLQGPVIDLSSLDDGLYVIRVGNRVAKVVVCR